MRSILLTVSFFHFFENIRKLLAFWCFQGVSKEFRGVSKELVKTIFVFVNFGWSPWWGKKTLKPLGTAMETPNCSKYFPLSLNTPYSTPCYSQQCTPVCCISIGRFYFHEDNHFFKIFLPFPQLCELINAKKRTVTVNWRVKES